MKDAEVCCVDCAHLIGDRTAMTGDELCEASPFPQAKHPVTGRMMPYSRDESIDFPMEHWQSWEHAFCKYVNKGNCPLFTPQTGENMETKS